MGTNQKACCDFHDRLDKKLHTLAYTGMVCGSHAVQLRDVPGNPGVKEVVADPEPDADGRRGQPVSEPEYCCFKCPTLKAAQ